MASALIARDVNRPSILFWVNFNEAWGLLTPPFWMDSPGIDYVSSMAQWVRTLDPTRPVEDHSPGGFSEFLDGGALPHVDTDINSFHIYDRSVTSFAARIDDHLAGQPLIVSEFGGLSADDTRGDSTYSLHGQLNVLRSRRKLQGFVYTQAYDVEWERNGLWTYDRAPKETGLSNLGIGLADLLGPNYLALAAEPALTVEAGLSLTVQAVGEVVSNGPAEELTWTLLSEDDEVVQSGVHPISNDGEFVVTQIALQPIAEAGIYRLLAALQGDDVELAKNGSYIVVEPTELPTHPLDEATFLASEGATCNGGACWCEGLCELSFKLAAIPADTTAVLVNLEVSTYDPDEPQTDGQLRSAEVTVKVGAQNLCSFQIPDAPADERGVLSHLLTPELRGAYGYSHSCSIPASALKSGNNTIALQSNLGLRVFTPRGGRFMHSSIAIPH